MLFNQWLLYLAVPAGPWQSALVSAPSGHEVVLYCSSENVLSESSG